MEDGRPAGSLSGRPLLVLSGGNFAAPPEFLEAWTDAQSELVRQSTRGGQIVVAEVRADHSETSR